MVVVSVLVCLVGRGVSMSVGCMCGCTDGDSELGGRQWKTEMERVR